jgi:hypothetical protein
VAIRDFEQPRSGIADPHGPTGLERSVAEVNSRLVAAQREAETSEEARSLLKEELRELQPTDRVGDGRLRRGSSGGVDLVGGRLDGFRRRVSARERKDERRVATPDHLEHEHDACADVTL